MWPLAMSYAVWVYNRLPLDASGPSPKEIWSSITCHESHLPRAHTFGCPVYVLDPKLQDGQSIPKWNSRVRQGIFVGFSPEHSTNVPLILNPTTQHISPQYHVIFDDEFTTVPALTTDAQRNDLFAELFTSSRERFVDDNDLTHLPSLPTDDAGDTIEGSDLLGSEWLSPDDTTPNPPPTSQTIPDLHAMERRPITMSPSKDPEGAITQASSPSEGASPISVPASSPSEGVSPIPAPSRLPRRARSSTWKDGPVAA